MSNNSLLIIKLKLFVMSSILYIIDEIKDLYIRLYGEEPDKAVQQVWADQSVDYLQNIKYEMISELSFY
jgi:hypothetical protein